MPEPSMLFNSFSENLNSFQKSSLRVFFPFYLGEYEKLQNETEDFLSIHLICK